MGEPLPLDSHVFVEKAVFRQQDFIQDNLGQSYIQQWLSLNADLRTALLVPFPEEEASYNRYGEGSERLSEVQRQNRAGMTLHLVTRRAPYMEYNPRKPQQEYLRLGKWRKMLDSWQLYYGTPQQQVEALETGVWIPRTKYNRKLRERVYKGIPDAMRHDAWIKLLGADKLLEENEPGWPNAHVETDSVYYRCLATPLPDSVRNAIGRDIRRTFRGFETLSDCDGVLRLARLLTAVTVYNSGAGYMQAYSFICAMLLGVMLEVEAFWVFNAIMKRGRKGKLWSFASLHCEGMPGVQMRCYILFKLLSSGVLKGGTHAWEMTVAASGDTLGSAANTQMWALKEFLTLFTRDLPLPIVLRILDRYFLMGDSVLLATQLALSEREMEGPICATGADIDKIMNNGDHSVLPSCCSPGYNASRRGHIVLQRFMQMAEAVDLEDGLDVLEREAALEKRVPLERLQALAEEWTQADYAKSVIRSATEECERLLCAFETLNGDPAERDRAQHWAFSSLRIPEIWDELDKSKLPKGVVSSDDDSQFQPTSDEAP